MLNWLFKKRGTEVSPAAPAPRAAALEPAAPARPSVDATEWAARLAAARGDDLALLPLALSAPLLQQRSDAVEAISTEAGLRLAEREFRKRDRKLHSRLKQRLDAAVTEREARSTADRLLAQARELLVLEVLPVNQLLALDKAWAALPAAALGPHQREEHAVLREQLDDLVRGRGEARQQLDRWIAAVQPLVETWTAQLEALATDGSASDATDLATTIEDWRSRRPASAAGHAADQAVDLLARAARRVESGLVGLEAMSLAPAGTSSAAGVVPASSTGVGALESRLVRLIEARRLRLQPAAPAPEEPTVPPAAPPDAASEVGIDAAVAPRTAGPSRPTPAQLAQLEQALHAGATAVADGRLAGLQAGLQQVERLLADARLVLPAALRERHQALRGEQRRLLDWQRWGGARARDELLAQAEALARASAIEPDGSAAKSEPAEPADPASAPPTDPTPLPRPAMPRRPAGLNLKQHAAQIQALRQQWKQLDQQGAPASQAHWQSFDSALQAAYLPVGQEQARMKAARAQNLAAREALLADLEGATPPDDPAEGDPTAWRQAGQVLGQFQTAWRQLGPLEHTVPAAARPALQQRLQHALARVEAPLQQARAEAIRRREQLIARAEALLQEGSERRGPADTARALRDLQGEWTDQARRWVLPRGVEADLWTRFKAAADNIQAARDQVHAARAAAEAAERSAEQSRQAAWTAQCRALAAALARCESAESGGAAAASAPDAAMVGTAGTDMATATDAVALPATWTRALQARRPDAGAAADGELLRLEAALDLPTPGHFQADRQQLKLQALKQTLEGRTGPAAPPPGELLLALLSRSGLDTTQRTRLHAVVAALGLRGPGALQ